MRQSTKEDGSHTATREPTGEKQKKKTELIDEDEVEQKSKWLCKKSKQKKKREGSC